jgi:MFS family permease
MLLWAAQAISQTAQNVIWYGILVLVQTNSNSSTHMGVAVLTLMLPSVFFGIVAGVYVDRWDKRWVLIATNALRAAVTVAYALVQDYLVLVYLVNFVFATISQFFSPAEAATIPSIVPRRLLLQANALFNLTYTASQLAGLVLIGPLVVNLLGIHAVFYVVAALFAACALLVSPLPRHVAGVVETARSGREALEALLADAREVALFVLSDRVVLLALGHWTLSSILANVLAVLAPGFVVNVLGIDAADSVFVLAPAGLGMVAGTVFLNRLGQWFDKHWMTNAGLVVVSASMLVLGLLGPGWNVVYRAAQALAGGPLPLLGFYGLISIVMLVGLLAGFAFVAIFVPAQTLMQERTPVALRGRLFAVAMVMSNVTSIAPLLLAGAVADILGVAKAFTLLGLGLFAITAASIRASPRGAPSPSESGR